MKAQLNILPLKRSRMLPRLALSLASSLAFMGLLQAPLVASAQVPPSAQEVARFSALHAAAHRGNVAAIAAAHRFMWPCLPSSAKPCGLW